MRLLRTKLQCRVVTTIVYIQLWRCTNERTQRKTHLNVIMCATNIPVNLSHQFKFSSLVTRQLYSWNKNIMSTQPWIAFNSWIAYITSSTRRYCETLIYAYRHGKMSESLQRSTICVLLERVLYPFVSLPLSWRSIEIETCCTHDLIEIVFLY